MEYELVYGLPKAEVLAQMAEELTEAAQAALKLRRAMDGANPTPISVDTGMKNLIEELADCQLCEDIITVSAINPAPAKKLAKELYHKIHPTTPIEQLEADIVERGRNW